MNKIITFLAIAMLTTGCSSTPLSGQIESGDRHQASKTQFYQDLNQTRSDKSVDPYADARSKLKRTPTETSVVLDQHGRTTPVR